MVYKPGANNPGDYMSRHPDPKQSDASHHLSRVDAYVNFITNNAVPPTVTLQGVKDATAADETLQRLARVIATQKWHEAGKDVSQYQHRIDRMVEEVVKGCLPCQAANHDPKPVCEPLHMSPLPLGPWQELSVDFCGPFPSGDYLLVVTDDFSRYPEVEILRSASAKAVIPHLDSIFARQGIPEVVRTGNGPPFNRESFQMFATRGFTHRRITPEWPRANGEAERLMKTLEKAIRTAVIQGKNWKQELFTFVRQHRATPHSTTGKSPSELLNGRKLKSTLPWVEYDEASPEIRQADATRKEKMKEYADKCSNAKSTDLSVGDKVLIKQPKQNKISTPFKPEPLQITHKKGSMITAQNGERTVTRNSSFFKKLPSNIPVHPVPNDEEEQSTPYIEAPETVEPVETVESTSVTINDSPTVEPVEPPALAPIESPALRRSARARRVPEHFKDYVI